MFLDLAEPVTVPKDEVDRAIERAERFFEGALKGLHKQMEATSDAYSMALRISSSLARRSSASVFSSSPMASPACAAARRTTLGAFESSGKSGTSRGSFVECRPACHVTRLISTSNAISEGRFPVSKCPSRQRMLNVRSFLSARGKINAGIRHSLHEEPDRFVAYNNGIVATVDMLKTTRLPDGRTAISRVQGFQIVNGGQTTASIDRAKKVDRVDLSSVFVPAKITLIDPPSRTEIVSRVSRYANTQNVIQMADFSANEPFHVELERLSYRIWCPGEQGRWFYERARGQYQVAKARLSATPAQARRFTEQTPPNRKFTKPEIGKYQHAWLLRPHVISMGAQKNFDRFMQELRTRLGKEWLPDDQYYRDLIAKAIIYRAADRIVKIERFPAYRANIVAYLVAYLSIAPVDGLTWKGSGRNMTCRKRSESSFGRGHTISTPAS